MVLNRVLNPLSGRHDTPPPDWASSPRTVTYRSSGSAGALTVRRFAGGGGQKQLRGGFPCLKDVAGKGDACAADGDRRAVDEWAGWGSGRRKSSSVGLAAGVSTSGAGRVGFTVMWHCGTRLIAAMSTPRSVSTAGPLRRQTPPQAPTRSRGPVHATSRGHLSYRWSYTRSMQMLATGAVATTRAHAVARLTGIGSPPKRSSSWIWKV